MGNTPEDRDARLASLQRWARLQQGRLASEEKERLHAEEIARAVTEARQRVGQAESLRQVAVIPIVITKPSDLPTDRAAVFAELVAGLREYKWADPIVSVCDQPKHVAPTAVDLARRHRPGAGWLLYMEDDVILGPDFGLLPGLLSEADERYPDAGLVSFYSGSIVEPGWSRHPMNLFGGLLCAAIRNADYLAGFRAFIDDDVRAADLHRTQSAGKKFVELPDAALGAFLSAEYGAYALWCPSLVQHADVTSALFGQPKRRRISPTYTEAYGQAPGAVDTAASLDGDARGALSERG